MASTYNVRKWWWGYRCSQGILRLKGFFGRDPVFEQAISHDAVNALEDGHYGAGYVPVNGGWIGSKRQCPRGLGGARCQDSGSGCSLHNYVLAYDIEYNYNSYIRARVTPEDFDEWWFLAVCKYTLAQVRAIEGIQNTFGEQMWKWLGWSIGDFMHWQINVPPWRCQVDWNTVPGVEVVDDMNSRRVLNNIGLPGLKILGAAGAFAGKAEWYFGSSKTSDDDNLVEVLLAWTIQKRVSAAAPVVEYVKVVKDVH